MDREPRVLRPDRKQLRLEPVDLEARIAADHRVRLVWAFVESLDLGPFYDRIESVEGHAGRPAIDPGEPSSFDSSEHGTRTFCPRGGTPLTFASTRSPTELDVTTCSLENPQALPPKDHTRTSAMLACVVLADELPEFPEARP